MDLKSKNVQQFLKSLNSNEVRYMLVGGMATIYHGHVRSTMDLDLWIQDTPKNKKKLVSSLKDMDVAGADLYENIDMIPGWSSVKIGRKGFEVDLMGYMKAYSEEDFDAVYKRSIITKVDDVPLRVINLEDLIVEKKANARPKDLDDIKNLKSKGSYNGIEVSVLNEKEFIDLLNKNPITSENTHKFSNTMFISILDTDKKPVLPNTGNYLNLSFDDVEKNVPGVAKTMSIKDAQKLNGFITMNKSKKKCFIHCSAGISRSGSLGKYIVDELKGNLNFFKDNNPHIDVKRHFLKILEKGKLKKGQDKGMSMGM